MTIERTTPCICHGMYFCPKDFGHKDKTEQTENLELQTPKQVMQAFLSGLRLQNTYYNDPDKENYLYLDESGFICEEDGAGAKRDRVPITMRSGEKWWVIK